MDNLDDELRLFTDNRGITHWQYMMAGVLLVCGYEQAYKSSFVPEPERFPTCMQCITMVDRGRHRYDAWGAA